MYISEDVEAGNGILIPIIAQKIELIDEDYLVECSKSIRTLVEKSVIFT